MNKMSNNFDSIVKFDDPLKSNVLTNTIESTDYEYNLSLRVKDFENESEEIKFIKSCERGIRSCPEYKVWTSYLKDALNYRICDITGENNEELTVEVHHHPYTLFDITRCVTKEFMFEEQEFCSFDVCTKVIEMHYQMRTPFVLMIKSMHEKFHNGFLKLPMELVHGDYKYFFENYAKYMDENTLNKVEERLAINSKNCEWSIGNYFTKK